MRLLPLALLLAFPVTVLAETFPLQSRITEVTVYPQGAKVTRVARYSLPAGTHQLQLLDLPQSAQAQTVRARLEGARLGAVTLRQDFVPPQPKLEDAVRRAAERRVEEAEEALRRKQDEIALLRLNREAAENSILFLRGLNQGEILQGAGAEELRAIVRMTGEETLAARRTVLQAEAEIRALQREQVRLEEDLQAARQALAALVPGQRETVQLLVAADSATPVEGSLVVSYHVSAAGWEPVNDAHLDLQNETLRLERGAYVEQFSGENWEDVALRLSTSQPSGAVAPSEVYAEQRWIEPPYPARSQPKLSMELSMPLDDMAEAVMAVRAPTELEAAATVLAEGLIVTYDYPQTVSLATGADAAKLSLGALAFRPDIVALAAPLFDSSAFLTASFTNDSGEIILPSSNTQLFLDGELVGGIDQPLLSAGGEARLPFGPIEGLQLTRVVKRNSGDRGILSKSNELTENTVIEVKNVTSRSWPLRLLDRVPYSEQEDLEITWSALPAPDEKDVEGRRNVLAWTFDLAAGASRKIKIDQRLSWPEEMELR